ncbi:MAG TPA: adenylate/guanylate cyclase domain-containing protein [Candidatus Limnocylindria bacterium]|nr:adenylate/guanylate cyclase domain-containing protein [Candidatus Limnocylindria bacterium]
MPRDLPTGTVTFLFSDVQGSTKLLHELGPEAYGRLLMQHRTVMRAAFAANGGVEVDTQGDAFFVAFASAVAAVAAAREARDKLASGRIRVRMGLHTGTPHLTEEGYVGEDVHLGARIASAGHGGQVLLSAATRSTVDGEISELGEHRLKDFAQAITIFQLGNERFPPLKTISNTNLPRPASSFVGREREVALIVSLVRDGARLVTLSGPGGTGKTRLAIEAGSELVGEFKAGVFWVDLSPIRDPALLIETISQVLGAKDGLVAHVAEREMLLLLDNLEQVVDAASDLGQVLERCPNLQLLVTSRTLLRLRGEVEYAVQPLAEREAVELFRTRANVQVDATVAEICRRLDHLPLAIELAAARAKVLSPTQIAERLEQRLPLLTSGARDLPERQRTLRGAIAWSYDLLTPGEQRLFARLAVFRRGWTLEAAERVADADLDDIQSLVESSLVRQDNGRFAMLETIREYAAERLDSSGEVDHVRRRHAEHFLAVAKEAEPMILGMAPRDRLDRLERDHDNLRASLETFESMGETQLALELGGLLWEFWCLRGHATEGWQRLEHLLTLDVGSTRPRAKVLIGSTHLAPQTGADPALMKQRAEEAVAIQREVGDAWSIAVAEHGYGSILCHIGDFAAARPRLEESVRLLRDVGDEHRELQAMRLLAWACNEVGESQRHRAIHEEIVRRARAIGDTDNTAFSLATLSWVATGEGKTAEALAMLEEAYRLDRQMGDPSAIDLVLLRFARALAFADLSGPAVRLLGAAEVMHEEAGWTYPDWVVSIQDTARARARAALGEDAFAEALEQGRRLTPDDAAAHAVAALKEGAPV